MKAPLLVFVPGGGFVAGDKSLYRHVGPAFARLGFVSAVVNYRLAPAHAWPAGAVDVASAIDWLAERADIFGAQPSSIYVLAQSAGAAHASSALFDRRLQPIRSAVLMSGSYRMDVSIAAANIRAYFGDDASKYDDRSPLTAAAGSALPVGLTVAEFDPQFLALQTIALATELIRRDGQCPPLLWNEDHSLFWWCAFGAAVCSALLLGRDIGWPGRDGLRPPDHWAVQALWRACGRK
ncbi:alpha/beta hydrolase fold [Rhizobiales bacterium GAS191]|nr:alpha/beta hydrolase fold [Rhizobiales bacterium GAS191]